MDNAEVRLKLYHVDCIRGRYHRKCEMMLDELETGLSALRKGYNKVTEERIEQCIDIIKALLQEDSQ